jgi:fibrillarin-like rRNA methylase
LPFRAATAVELIDHRREQLQTEAMQVGERVYTERPTAFIRRNDRYWKASRAGRLALHV